MAQNYANISQAAVEITVTKQWFDSASSAHPFLAVMLQKLKLPGSMPVFDVKTNPKGGKVLAMPVVVSASAGDAVSVANQFSAVSNIGTAPTATDVATYNFATFRAGFTLGTRETRSVQNGEAEFFNIFQGNTAAAMAKLANQAQTQMDANVTDSDGVLLGLPFCCSADQTVGGIDQSTITAWQSNVISVATTLTTAHIVKGIVAAQRRSVTQGYETPDLIMLSERADSFLYSVIMNTIGADTLVPVNQDSISYGPQAVRFHGGWLVPNTGMASGLVLGLNTSTWAIAGDLVPQYEDVVRVATKNVYEHMWTQSYGIGCGAPARQFKLTGASG